ncbi:MAG: hypothetical protein KatS3mg028_0839 [Bacteroidia bacterium]|nr:MAG: hypothetical protein KatS3mg028_0839 [Bacteroidia bacterium]
MNYYVLMGQVCMAPLTANCSDAVAGTSRFYLNGKSNIDFTFDEMNEYVRGITYSGATQLRLKVDEINPGLCKWKLIMIIENNGYLPNNEWEPLVYYGGSGTVPNLNLIEVSVWNGCGTALYNGVFRTFSNNINNDTLSIIPDLVIRNLPGPCDGTHINGPGSYLTDYNEFSFNIDYRITPGFALRPGSYQIRIRFCLVEIP